MKDVVRELIWFDDACPVEMILERADRHEDRFLLEQNSYDVPMRARRVVPGTGVV